MPPLYKSYLTRLFVLLLGIIFFTSCLSDNITDPPADDDDLQLSNTDAVPADGILEAVTWNIEWYGSTSRGPSDELQQTKNILRIADSLKADLYALQEIYNQARLDSLTKYMTGFSGFVADYITYNQRMAFIYNTETIVPDSSGAITVGQDNYDWAGRYPLYFSFKYNYQETSFPIFAIVIHAKANSGENNQEREEAYNRRVSAAESLYTYLQNEHPDAHVILLGDFNDDVDVSIYNSSSPSPYEDFITNDTHFKAITSSISEKGRSSYIAGNYNDLIDHIVISDEFFSIYTPSSEEIYFEADSFIDNYVNTTSDHLPVWAKLDFTQNKKGNSN